MLAVVAATALTHQPAPLSSSSFTSNALPKPKIIGSSLGFWTGLAGLVLGFFALYIGLLALPRIVNMFVAGKRAYEEGFLQNGGPNEQAMKNEIVKNNLGLNTAQVYPVVRFTIADGTLRDILLKREDWKVELPNGEVQASRSQIPLILAWALSIHKAQGQTLDRVKVDLARGCVVNVVRHVGVKGPDGRLCV